MITTKRSTGLFTEQIDVRPMVTGYDVLSDVDQNPWTTPRDSLWQRLLGGVKRLAATCMGLEDEYAMQEREGGVRNQIRREMQYSHYGHPERTSVEEVVRRVYAETGYDLGTQRQQHEQALQKVVNAAESRAAALTPVLEDENEIVVGTVTCPVVELEEGGVVDLQISADDVGAAWEQYARSHDLLSGFLALPEHPRLYVIPRFVAAMVVTLRSHFGRLPLNEANRLLVEREYLRIARKGCVRDGDIAHHSQWVYNTYFSEDLFEQTATVRARVPRWMKAAGRPTLVQPPVVC